MAQRDPESWRSSGTWPLILTVLSGSWFQAWMVVGKDGETTEWDPVPEWCQFVSLLLLIAHYSSWMKWVGGGGHFYGNKALRSGTSLQILLILADPTFMWHYWSYIVICYI